jgi:exonuclease III
MAYTYRIATLNIKGISSLTRIRILEDFLVRQEIDLMFLQEVTHANINMVSQYTAQMNIGNDGRGTAILAKEVLILTNIQKIPSGRGIAATIHVIRIVNIYAASGSERGVKGEPSIMEKLRLCYLQQARL